MIPEDLRKRYEFICAKPFHARGGHLKEIKKLIERIAALEQFMVRTAKELECLPSFSDPENGNEHIFRALAALKGRA